MLEGENEKLYKAQQSFNFAGSGTDRDGFPRHLQCFFGSILHPGESMIDWEYEWCEICERPNKIGFVVPDEDWKNIAPDRMKDGRGVLCYNCFEMLSYEKGIPFTLVLLSPVTRVEGSKVLTEEEGLEWIQKYKESRK